MTTKIKVIIIDYSDDLSKWGNIVSGLLIEEFSDKAEFDVYDGTIGSSSITNNIRDANLVLCSGLLFKESPGEVELLMKSAPDECWFGTFSSVKSFLKESQSRGVRFTVDKARSVEEDLIAIMEKFFSLDPTKRCDYAGLERLS